MPVLAPLRATPLRLRIAGHRQGSTLGLLTSLPGSVGLHTTAPEHRGTLRVLIKDRTVLFMSHCGVAAGPGAILLPLRYVTVRCFMPVLAPLRATPLRLRISGHRQGSTLGLLTSLPGSVGLHATAPEHRGTLRVLIKDRTVLFMSHCGVAAGPGAILLPLRYITVRCFMPVLAPLRATPLRLRIAGHKRPERVALNSTKLRLHEAMVPA